MGKTLILIKSEAITRGLVGKIISRFERADLNLEEMKTIKPSMRSLQSIIPVLRSGLKTQDKKL